MTERAASQPAPLMRQQEAKEAFDAGVALFVDVRRPDQFDRLRISGAISIPMRGQAEQFFNLPKDKDIVIY